MTRKRAPRLEAWEKYSNLVQPVKANIFYWKCVFFSRSTVSTNLTIPTPRLEMSRCSFFYKLIAASGIIAFNLGNTSAQYLYFPSHYTPRWTTERGEEVEYRFRTLLADAPITHSCCTSWKALVSKEKGQLARRDIGHYGERCNSGDFISCKSHGNK